MKKDNNKPSDPDLQKVGVALRRAARRARETAEKTNTPLVVYENGGLVLLKVSNRNIKEKKLSWHCHDNWDRAILSPFFR
jgi:hypothetical protein